MQGWIWIFFLKDGGDVLGVHDVGSISETDIRDGVGDGVEGRGVGWDTEGFEVRRNLVEFDPLGGVGDAFVVEEQAG